MLIGFVHSPILLNDYHFKIKEEKGKEVGKDGGEQVKEEGWWVWTEGKEIGNLKKGNAKEEYFYDTIL